jgi:hypothetical protein
MLYPKTKILTRHQSKNTPTGKAKPGRAGTKAVEKVAQTVKKPVWMAGFDDDLLTKQDPEMPRLRKTVLSGGRLSLRIRLKFWKTPQLHLNYQKTLSGCT